MSKVTSSTSRKKDYVSRYPLQVSRNVAIVVSQVDTALAVAHTGHGDKNTIFPLLHTLGRLVVQVVQAAMTGYPDILADRYELHLEDEYRLKYSY